MPQNVRYAHFGRQGETHTAPVQNALMADRTPEADRLRRARERRGFKTARDAAQFFGWNYDTYSQHERGERGIGRVADKYAKAYRVSQAWLLTGEGGDPDNGAITHVPLVGQVGAGAEAHFYATGDDPAEMVSAPENATASTVAVQVRGQSLGALFDSWLVFYDDIKTPVTTDLIGKLCVVGLPDDRVLVKMIQRSRSDGLYHLLSNTEGPILDVEIMWAAKVKTMMPRS